MWQSETVGGGNKNGDKESTMRRRERRIERTETVGWMEEASGRGMKWLYRVLEMFVKGSSCV